MPMCAMQYFISRLYSNLQKKRLETSSFLNLKKLNRDNNKLNIIDKINDNNNFARI